MAKLSAKGYDLWAFFNASTENLLVLTGFFRFRVSTKFLRQVDVLDGQQTQIYVVVEGFGADHFLTAELAVRQCLAITGIKRPFVFALEMLDDVLKKPYRSQATVLLAAVSAVFQIHNAPPDYSFGMIGRFRIFRCASSAFIHVFCNNGDYKNNGE